MRVWRYCSIVFVLAGLFCFGLIQFGSQLFSAGAQANQKSGSKAANQQSEELYFGSSTTEIGRRVWFLTLDLPNRRGKLFMRPSILELTNVKVSETGHVTFRSETDIGYVVYQFEGDQGPKGISGRFDFIRAEPDTEEKVFTTAPVVLEKITLPTQNPQSPDVGGVYSNVRYNERSGDLNGEELILFWRGNEPRGIFLMYEEDMEPLAISDVSLSGANLKFRVVSLGGEQDYAGTFSGNRLQLRRTDANASPYFKMRVLLKKGEVRALFEKRKGSTRR